MVSCGSINIGSWSPILASLTFPFWKIPEIPVKQCSYCGIVFMFPNKDQYWPSDQYSQLIRYKFTHYVDTRYPHNVHTIGTVDISLSSSMIGQFTPVLLSHWRKFGNALFFSRRFSRLANCQVWPAWDSCNILLDYNPIC